MIVIQAKDMTKDYPIGGKKFTALHNINVSFEKGEFSGLIGPSGSGKTTLLNIIGSLDTPTSGNVKVLNKSIENLRENEAAMLRSKHIGFIFQTFNLFPVYTVFENIEFPLLFTDMSKEERTQKVLDAIDWVKLNDKTNIRPTKLSGGESQRVAIARAIVKHPDIVLADEPTANLDRENSFNILDTMLELNKKLKTTFIFATHDEKVIDYLKRRIHLVDGKIVGDEKVR